MYLTKKKAITQYIVNQDKDFIRYKKPTTIIVNDVNGLIDNDANEQINNEIYSIYKKNFVDMLPSCNCGHFNAKYLDGKT